MYFPDAILLASLREKEKCSWLILFSGASADILERFCNIGEHDPRHYVHVMKTFVCKAYCPKATKLKQLEEARYHLFKTKPVDLTVDI